MLSQNLPSPGPDRRMPSSWYRWGKPPAVFHWWEQSPDGELWKTPCGAHVVGNAHRYALSRGYGIGMGKQCKSCAQIKYERPRTSIWR